MLRSVVEQDQRLVSLSFNPPQIFHFSLCWRPGAHLIQGQYDLHRYRGRALSTPRLRSGPFANAPAWSVLS